MDRIVNVHMAKTHLSKLLDEVRAGEVIILAKAGVPYGRLVPIDATPPQRKPGRVKGKLAESFFARLPANELAGWKKSS